MITDKLVTKFLTPWKKHVQNGRSNSTPRILTLVFEKDIDLPEFCHQFSHISGFFLDFLNFVAQKEYSELIS